MEWNCFVWVEFFGKGIGYVLFLVLDSILVWCKCFKIYFWVKDYDIGGWEVSYYGCYYLGCYVLK